MNETELPADPEILNTLLVLPGSTAGDWKRRKPLLEWVRELFPEFKTRKQEEVVLFIESVYTSIYSYMLEHYNEETKEFVINDEEACEWVYTDYPWMNEDNVKLILLKARKHAFLSDW